jgi:alpha-beta hydrolase superfamily lysophospholipase
MQTHSFVVTGKDGTALFVYRWLPPGPCKAIVQVAHGLAEHSGRYAGLAEALTESGYGVYAGDHRGHGRTCKDKSQLGFFAERQGWRLCLDDLWTINRHIAAQHPGTPIVLLGHSMGSSMVQQFIGEHGDALAGAVLSGPNGKPTALAAVGRFVLQIEPMLADLRAAGLQNPQYRCYPEARHKLFHETNRDEVTRDLIGWLDSIAKR